MYLYRVCYLIQEVGDTRGGGGIVKPVVQLTGTFSTYIMHSLCIGMLLAKKCVFYGQCAFSMHTRACVYYVLLFISYV